MRNTKKTIKKSTNKSHRWWLVLLLLIPAALVLLGLSIITALILRSNQPLETHDTPTAIATSNSAASDATSTTAETATDTTITQTDSAQGSQTPDSSTIKSIADLPKPINDGNYEAIDVAVEKTIIINEPIFFTKSTVNEVNQSRGTTKIAQTGVNGNKKLTYLVKYNSQGQSLAVQKIKEEVTKEPVAEITKVGVSDYNLNHPPQVQYYNSSICLVTETDTTGCAKTATSYSFAKSFELDGKHYLYFAYEINGRRDVSFAPAILAGNGFNYAGQSYFYEVRHAAATNPLTAEDCTTFGLACGIW